MRETRFGNNAPCTTLTSREHVLVQCSKLNKPFTSFNYHKRLKIGEFVFMPLAQVISHVVI